MGRWMRAAVLGTTAALVGWDLYISRWARPFLYDDLAEVPTAHYGLVLGTSPKVAPDEANPFYRARVEAAARLYRAGKVRRLILSGHQDAYYSEPQALRADLIRRGVPPSALIIDSGGHRTWESIRHLCRTSHVDRVVIVSQRFHNARAVFIARWHGVPAVGYNARAVNGWRGVRVRLRETLARLRMAWDMLKERRSRQCEAAAAVSYHSRN